MVVFTLVLFVISSIFNPIYSQRAKKNNKRAASTGRSTKRAATSSAGRSTRRAATSSRTSTTTSSPAITETATTGVNDLLKLQDFLSTQFTQLAERINNINEKVNFIQNEIATMKGIQLSDLKKEVTSRGHSTERILATPIDRTFENNTILSLNRGAYEVEIASAGGGAGGGCNSYLGYRGGNGSLWRGIIHLLEDRNNVELWIGAGGCAIPQNKARAGGCSEFRVNGKIIQSVSGGTGGGNGNIGRWGECSHTSSRTSYSAIMSATCAGGCGGEGGQENVDYGGGCGYGKHGWIRVRRVRDLPEATTSSSKSSSSSSSKSNSSSSSYKHSRKASSRHSR